VLEHGFRLLKNVKKQGVFGYLLFTPIIGPKMGVGGGEKE
jgi:hypothetical protein